MWKHFFFVFVIATILYLIIGCGASQAQIIDPPQSIRQGNYSGSCAHAATITMLRWQGQYEMATWWQQNFRGGEHFTGLARKAKFAKLDYAMLKGGDTDILEYATATGRGAVVDWTGEKGVYIKRGRRDGHHAVFFCGFSTDGETAAFINPNTNRMHFYTRQAFLTHWHKSGGRSFMTLYTSPKN